MKRALALAAFLALAGPAGGEEPAAPPASPTPEPAPWQPPAAPEPRPTMLDQTGVAADGPQSFSDRILDDRIRASVAAAQAMQGPLDGRWTLVGEDNRPIFIFQFVDPAGGRGPLEAVWRDLRRPVGTNAYGVVWSLERLGFSLNLSFLPVGATGPVKVALQGDVAGGWRGQMTENGAVTSVFLRRSY